MELDERSGFKGLGYWIRGYPVQALCFRFIGIGGAKVLGYSGGRSVFDVRPQNPRHPTALNSLGWVLNPTQE